MPSIPHARSESVSFAHKSTLGRASRIQERGSRSYICHDELTKASTRVFCALSLEHHFAPGLYLVLCAWIFKKKGPAGTALLRSMFFFHSRGASCTCSSTLFLTFLFLRSVSFAVMSWASSFPGACSPETVAISGRRAMIFKKIFKKFFAYDSYLEISNFWRKS